MKHVVARVWAALLGGLVLFIALFSLVLSPKNIFGAFVSDKFYHTAAYAVLTIVLSGFLHSFLNISLRRELLSAFILATALGGLLELLQAGVLGRVADAKDMYANMLGSAIGVVLYVVARIYFKQ